MPFMKKVLCAFADRAIWGKNEEQNARRIIKVKGEEATGEWAMDVENIKKQKKSRIERAEIIFSPPTNNNNNNWVIISGAGKGESERSRSARSEREVKITTWQFDLIFG